MLAQVDEDGNGLIDFEEFKVRNLLLFLSMITVRVTYARVP